MTAAFLVQWLLYFLEWLAAASVLGLLSYWMFRSRWLVVRLLGVVALVFFGRWYLVNIWPLFQLGVGAMRDLQWLACVLALSVVQAFIERGISPRRLSWGRHLARCLGSNLCCFCAAAYLVRWYILIFSRALGPGFAALTSWEYGGYYGFLVGAMLTPLSISFYRWMIPTLHLRPGVDRHLDEGL